MSLFIDNAHKDTRSIAKRIVFAVLGAAALSVGTFVLAKGVWVPALLEVSDDFTYSADVISLDNFYDEKKKVFSGEQRSVTTFDFTRIEDKEDSVDDVALIKNVFDVRTVTGDRIISIERTYGVDDETGRHVPGAGDHDREGYLFAPHGVTKDESFIYWHVNYDRPIEMVFAGEEIIEGVRTYRFRSDFGVDQTDSLTHLPGVPETLGVNLDVSLTIWIEPTTGWLVKYADKAVAYYYDQETKVRTHPWNSFSNRYARASALQQADYAAKLRTEVLLVKYVVPLLVFIFGVAVLLWRILRRSDVLAGVLLLGAVLVINTATVLSAQEPVTPISIGISRWVPYGNTGYDDNIQGFKDALTLAGYHEGEDVIYTTLTANADAEQQQEVARQFLIDNVDMVYSLTTPGTDILKESIRNRPIIFSVVTYPVEAGIVTSLVHSGTNLVGTRNWVSIDTQLNVFREIVPRTTTIGFVHRTGEFNSEIQIEEMRSVAAQYDIAVVEVAGRNVAELSDALAAMPQSVDAIYSACDTLVQGEAEEVIIAYAQEHALPSFSCNDTGPAKGDLVGTVADMYQIGRRAGEQAVLVLEGVSPSSLETSTVARPFIYINARTAAALGITIPQDILTRAKEIFY
ncbi:DUF3068 domain-containing protein [Candidatus Kaiserbacteria bacterium]|nr:DUF3068 domain-containing protein [Candidatus Kaiserbacteria bacterium]